MTDKPKIFQNNTTIETSAPNENLYKFGHEYGWGWVSIKANKDKTITIKVITDCDTVEVIKVGLS